MKNLHHFLLQLGGEKKCDLLFWAASAKAKATHKNAPREKGSADVFASRIMDHKKPPLNELVATRQLSRDNAAIIDRLGLLAA